MSSGACGVLTPGRAGGVARGRADGTGLRAGTLGERVEGTCGTVDSADVVGATSIGLAGGAGATGAGETCCPAAPNALDGSTRGPVESWRPRVAANAAI